MSTSLLRSDRAPSPRTLVDVFAQTVAACPDAPAVDNGAVVLTYAEFADEAETLASALHEAGIGRGDRVGVRVRSGTVELYIAIMGTLLAGAAYVPVDADDPDERAATVFGEAEVAAVIGNDLGIETRGPRPGPVSEDEVQTLDDAWIIFTSGSTGRPKGVAVTHRNAAAFVDAEAGLFLQDAPIGTGDRVMAGLSVAFDASCEEMWLAWRHGACLVPAPRSLVRSGMELGPWLTANRITVVSTVPTLLALWPPEALERVRLLILGGEACPPELATRYARAGREMWNTYGPTEATVVACAAQLHPGEPVRIGLPLDGWDLAVVDAEGRQVAAGESGELVIGGVGLARYLDPVKDAEKYAPMPSLGWTRAYRSGDIVAFHEAGLVFAGRADDQIKLGGRRIELGEIDAALTALPGVGGGAAAVRTTKAGNRILVGYLACEPGFELETAVAQLRRELPEALVPRLAAVPTLPTRTSGKIDRDALPWPVATLRHQRLAAEPAAGPANPEEKRLADLWLEILGVEGASPDDDFFDLGGGSLSAAQLVSRLRESHPEVTVADVYEQPRLRDLAALLREMQTPAIAAGREVDPVPLKTQLGQLAGVLGVRTIVGLRWLTWLLLGDLLLGGLLGLDVPTVSWWWTVLAAALLLSPPGRLVLAAGAARLVLTGVAPGDYPRGGKVHLRVWLAERIADELGAGSLSCAPWLKPYARMLGARIGPEVALHSAPPVTGMLRVGRAASIEPEVDLTGHWIDGDTFHLGEVTVRAGARVGTRSMLLPGSVVGKRAEVAAGSALFGEVPADEAWGGAPAAHLGTARGPWSSETPPRRPVWAIVYAATALGISALPLLAGLAGLLVARPIIGDPHGWASWLGHALVALPAGGIAGLLVLAAAIAISVRVLGAGLQSGHHPLHGALAWRAWTILRLLDEARSWLFALYSSSLTPAWLRLLGAKVGKDVEASTVLLIPSLATISDGAFLADDTLLGGYELGGGWLRVEHTKVGKRAFVGNSGMTAPGRKVPKGSLVAVLSAAPSRSVKAKSGSSWLGSPPVLLRRSGGSADDTRTYAPARRLRIARAAVEAARIVPTLATLGVGVVVAVTLGALAQVHWWLAAVLSGVVILAAGVLAAGISTGAKWLIVGRFRPSEHPLWSTLVWRSELADTFVETMGAPWWARATTGTPLLNAWLRTLGARIGRGVWCETYWLPEADLIELRDGACVNQGCVVQTHLFHDRVLSMDRVVLARGATLGPNSVVLPAARLGKHATVGPVSLVMRGEVVPDRTRWIGNPIGPWVDEQ